MGPHPLRYSLTIEPQGYGYLISNEALVDPGNPAPPFIQSAGADVRYFDGVNTSTPVRPAWQHHPLETSLAQAPKSFGITESFREILGYPLYYHALDVAPLSPVRQPQPMRPSLLPGPNGQDLVSCLYTLREAHRDHFEAVCDSLAAAFPGFDRLDFPPVAAGTLAVAWRDKRFSRPLYMRELSEGTLRFLWLTATLQSPSLPAVTLLDEPEVSLHPDLLRLFAELMREASSRTQLIVATHSDRLIRFLRPDEVLVMDSTDIGTAQICR